MIEYGDMAEPDFATLDGDALLTSLQQQAVERGVSDLHLTPEKKAVRLEWRLHGILTRIADVSPKQYEGLLRRVKFESKLKLNITEIPQDGQYSFPAGERRVNVRVATLPTLYGESLTLRLLDPARGILPLEKLGFTPQMHETLRQFMEVPQGLLLVTGPTGSGKTTTLYALLSTIVGKNRNIVTLEDPIEYELAGITQSEIDLTHDYTFANGLRAILRHDPDVILVGEIRDTETAQTAINASLTGHLVLSTLHTNSAIETIPRLLSMGVSPYTLAPALRGVLSQRLVRRLTDACRGATCDPAANASYGGQAAVAELLPVTTGIQQLILSLEQGPAIEAQARKDGFRTIREAAEKLMKEGVTTKEEVERVLG